MNRSDQTTDPMKVTLTHLIHRTIRETLEDDLSIDATFNDLGKFVTETAMSGYINPLKRYY